MKEIINLFSQGKFEDGYRKLIGTICGNSNSIHPICKNKMIDISDAFLYAVNRKIPHVTKEKVLFNIELIDNGIVNTTFYKMQESFIENCLIGTYLNKNIIVKLNACLENNFANKINKCGSLILPQDIPAVLSKLNKFSQNSRWYKFIFIDSIDLFFNDEQMNLLDGVICRTGNFFVLYQAEKKYSIYNALYYFSEGLNSFQLRTGIASNVVGYRTKPMNDTFMDRVFVSETFPFGNVFIEKSVLIPKEGSFERGVDFIDHVKNNFSSKVVRFSEGKQFARKDASILDDYNKFDAEFEPYLIPYKAENQVTEKLSDNSVIGFGGLILVFVALISFLFAVLIYFFL